MTMDVDEIYFHCHFDTFYACGYGSIHGCCSDDDYGAVCGEGCENDELYPAYFESYFHGHMTDAIFDECNDDSK